MTQSPASCGMMQGQYGYLDDSLAVNAGCLACSFWQVPVEASSLPCGLVL